MRAVLLVALSLGACVEVPPALCTDESDHDRDGWACAGAVPDCDDAAAEIHPGAIDDCVAPADEDCSGAPRVCEGSLQGMTASTESTADTWEVRGGGITVTFEESLQWVLASIVTEADGVELVSRDPSRPEQYVGVELYQPFDQWQVSTALPSVVDAGPAYVRIRVTWANTPVGQAATGVSTFGIFPNATIHRHERVTNDTAFSQMGLFLVTHWSFDSTRFSRFVSDRNDTALTPTTTDNALHVHTAGEDTGVLCAFEPDDDRRVTMAWRDTPAAAGSRAILGQVVDPAAPRLAFNYDWIRGSSTPIEADTRQSITALAIDAPDAGGTGCGSAATLHSELRPPGMDIIAGLPGETADAGGYVVDEGVYEIAAATGESFIEVLPGRVMDRGLMLRALIDAAPGVTVWRNGERLAAFEDYLIQTGDGGVTVFFPDQLAADDVIRVAAPGGEP